MKIPLNLRFFEDINFGIIHSKSNNMINIFRSLRCSHAIIRWKNTHVGDAETKRVYLVSHPHTSINIKDCDFLAI